ncbi:MAG TPA: ATP-dependent DNA helicase RecG [Gemmatimonadota bacterium]|nr:ATP-dependent DNA helicase RecG [Gemmatimonadota bacterium]
MSPRSLLAGSVQYLKGVGPRRAERFARLDVRTGRDLLYHIPHRYEDATTVTPIASLEPGDEATVIGRIVSKGVLNTRKGLRIFRAVLRDSSGLIEAAWPGQPWLDRSLSRGDLLLASGPVRFFHGRQLQPREHTVLASGDEEAEDGGGGRSADDGGSAAGGGSADDGGSAGGQGSGSGKGGTVFPVYPATEGLSHRQIRGIVSENLGALLREAAERDPVPEAWREELGLARLGAALRALHRPRAMEELEPARRRIAFDELLFLQLLHARARHRLRQETTGIAHDAPADLTSRFLEGLPFRLTGAQERAWEEIREDMERAERMYRLLQGDVGCGKTVVAAAALLRSVESGHQAALMAPTELLAEQHLRTLTELTSGLDVEPLLLTGRLTPAERRSRLEALASGRARLVVGTHALIQEDVGFADLGLAVIDEQHRFGVEQRRLLRDASGRADMLVMSATPIPRSLALTLYGDLDLSVIDEMPPARRPVVTAVRGPEAREAAFAFLREKVGEGRQAYVVYPLIEESEALDARSATEMRERLAARFPDLAVELLHGRLSAGEKEDVMRRFLAGEADLLVATTVIEVGIDVPNATLMYIEEAERFGLAQLHQLRGRVGRGGEQSYCVAFHSGEGEPPDRLRAFAATTDGFELARADLRLRGPGDLFGPEQHGVPALRFADLERDADLAAAARRWARELVEGDPSLGRPEHRGLARELAERHGDREGLYGVG